MDVTLPDGSVYSSSQLIHASDRADQSINTPMVGIILAISPSDDEENLTANVEQDQNGWRHECQVLVTDANNEPNLILENVVIPPPNHAGIDNFSEDLPRGKLRSLDGKKLSDHFNDHDLSNIDAEWCVIQFLGGSLDRPYISSWWSHPLNKHDPATSGQAVKGNSLTQVDKNKNKYRLFRRINGVQVLVSPEGDVYLDTTEANSKVDIQPKLKRMGMPNGGSVQVDIKSTKQLEFNWNAPVEGLKAGSTSASQSREESKPHLSAPKKPVGDPTARETKRSLIRGSQFDLLFKTSGYNISCQDSTEDGGQKGECVVAASDQITLTQKEADESLAATINLANGEVVVSGKDGSAVTVSEDQIVLISKSKAMVSVKGSTITISGSGGVTLSTPVSMGGPTGGTDVLIKGTTFDATYSPLLSGWSTFHLALKTYAAAIQPIADPTGIATSTLLSLFG
jgi:hypothetical protein